MIQTRRLRVISNVKDKPARLVFSNSRANKGGKKQKAQMTDALSRVDQIRMINQWW